MKVRSFFAIVVRISNGRGVSNRAHEIGYQGVEVWHFQLLKSDEDPHEIAKS